MLLFLKLFKVGADYFGRTSISFYSYKIKLVLSWFCTLPYTRPRPRTSLSRSRHLLITWTSPHPALYTPAISAYRCSQNPQAAIRAGRTTIWHSPTWPSAICGRFCVLFSPFISSLGAKFFSFILDASIAASFKPASIFFMTCATFWLSLGFMMRNRPKNHMIPTPTHSHHRPHCRGQ
jgi:hypothetical protein